MDKKAALVTAILSFELICIMLVSCAPSIEQPLIEARRAPILTVEQLTFKDSNKNGFLDSYEDWRLSINERIENLVGQMTLEEKVGLMFHPNIAVTEDGNVKFDLSEEEKKALADAQEESYAGPIGPDGQAGFGGMMPGQMLRTATAKDYIVEKNFRIILNNGVAEPRIFAKWSNGMQEVAEETRLGIPIMFSSDPRHGASLGAHVSGTQYFSQWPSREGQFGIAATRDLELVREFGRVTAEEYRAVGLHMILGPQIDVTTEPRWGRNAGCFSESAELTADMIRAFLEGAQGESVGPDKILAMIKHWPGSGPHLDGQGRQLVYPGNNFAYHLIPWQAAIDAGAIAVMGYYSGTPFDNGLGVNYSRYIMTELLCEKMGFNGVICSDWGVISRTGPLREDLADLSIKDRFKMSIEAGVDQFGSESDPTMIIELVREGQIGEERINLAAKRILRWHFRLGLFENPYVDPQAAATTVRSEENQKLGYQAQLKSIVLLSNDGTLPVMVNTQKPRVFISGIDAAMVSEYIETVENPAAAELAILRVNATESRSLFEAGAQSADFTIEFPPATLSMIQEISATGIPTVVALNLSGTLAVLPKELFDSAGATLMLFDVLDNALMEVIFGRSNPTGKLPFELPSSMEAVRNQLEDVPFDSKDPLFEYGFGLSY